MNAKELRIGNLFIEKYSKKIIPVLELIRDGSIVFDFECMGVWQAEPIPITIEWLLKFGFVYDDNWHFFIGENPLTRDHLLDICWIDGDDFPFYRNGFFKIKYVHELQNLYFALTGTEFTYEIES